MFNLLRAIFAFFAVVTITSVLLCGVLIVRVFSVSPLVGLFIVGPIFAALIGGFWPRRK